MKRSAPAVHVLVERFGLWNACIGVLVLLSAAGLVAWLVDAGAARHAPAAGLVPFFTVFAALALVAPLFALRRRPVSLRWDGQIWHLGLAHRMGDEPWDAEEVAVRIDLGVWMLLQIRSTDPGFPRGLAWLPVQKQGLYTQWHALRCAFFAAGGRGSFSSADGAGRAGEP